MRRLSSKKMVSHFQICKINSYREGDGWNAPASAALSRRVCIRLTACCRGLSLAVYSPLIARNRAKGLFVYEKKDWASVGPSLADGAKIAAACRKGLKATEAGLKTLGRVSGLLASVLPLWPLMANAKKALPRARAARSESCRRRAIWRCYIMPARQR